MLLMYHAFKIIFDILQIPNPRLTIKKQIDTEKQAYSVTPLLTLNTEDLTKPANVSGSTLWPSVFITERSPTPPNTGTPLIQ